jgi:multiple sugar transport system ATP-binding protein
VPSVSFDRIFKRYGAVTVLHDLNLTIDHGDFLVLLGPSGCGKTTLLNLLAGLAEVTSGRIMIGDRDVTELEPRDRGLAMVFQSYALYPTKTVEGNLHFSLASSGLGRAERDQRVAWAAQLLQLEPLMKRRPAELSGGQRQRVAIGRALVKHAEVLLFDEPLSNLDAKLRAEMRIEIKQLHDRLSPTIVYVTHDQIEAMTMATHIAVMNGGVIQQFGPPDEIYERPANLFVAGFIGSPPMNLLPAKFAVQGAKPMAIAADGFAADLTNYPFVTRPAEGADIRLGMRPEHFHLGGAAAPDGAMKTELPITHVERTGSDAIVSLAVASGRLDARIDPEAAARLKVGDRLTAEFPGHKISLFNATTGLRL